MRRVVQLGVPQRVVTQSHFSVPGPMILANPKSDILMTRFFSSAIRIFSGLISRWMHP